MRQTNWWNKRALQQKIKYFRSCVLGISRFFRNRPLSIVSEDSGNEIGVTQPHQRCSLHYIILYVYICYNGAGVICGLKRNPMKGWVLCRKDVGYVLVRQLSTEIAWEERIVYRKTLFLSIGSWITVRETRLAVSFMFSNRRLNVQACLFLLQIYSPYWS